ncbi:MAG TPA: metallophosphoesterase family protein [Phycisphaerae bacterium]|nr:metallophosphoesterase family protein [Phycisphaerae bacterium]HPS51987.1 metallophosphoesterase family protein [Phycisphaerae bacterium]
MLAIISDIHSNIEALAAVLDDIRRRGVRKTYCLGDIIGYGPDPGECLDMVQANTFRSILGNHDHAVLYGPEHFNSGAEGAIYWTRKRLEETADRQALQRRWEYLASLDERVLINPPETGGLEMLLVHGSPRRPISEYVFPDDSRTSPTKMAGIFERFSHLCFVGHTHLPGVFTEKDGFVPPADLGGVYEITDNKALINVGSVGQPRDRDPRASYVVVDDKKVEFIRVPYDVNKTVLKVFNTEDLDNFLGSRLQEGR